jgi:hypothetical protein
MGRLFGQEYVKDMEWSDRERRRMNQDDTGFRSAIEAGAAGAVRHGDRRRNRLGDPETKEKPILRVGGGAQRREHVTV